MFVLAASQDSKTMNTLISQQIHGRTTLVLGSAPGAVVPAEYDRSSWCLICVNASGWTARRLGLGTPDITIVTSGALRKSSISNVEMRTAVDGLNTNTLIVRLITRNFLKRILAQVEIQLRLRWLNFGRNRLYFMGRDIWSPILDATIGPRLRSSEGDNFYVSTGVFACLFAIYFGASRIYVAGIDPDSIGHSYSTSKLPRDHVFADRLAIQALQARNDFFLCHSERIDAIPSNSD
jgi:hypothetical protein